MPILRKKKQELKKKNPWTLKYEMLYFDKK